MKKQTRYGQDYASVDASGYCVLAAFVTLVLTLMYFASEAAEEEEANDNNASLANNLDDSTEPAANVADFRAAGDGWEGEEDLDYVIEEDMLLNHGGFSDDNTDDEDDDVILHRIIMVNVSNAEYQSVPTM